MNGLTAFLNWNVNARKMAITEAARTTDNCSNPSTCFSSSPPISIRYPGGSEAAMAWSAGRAASITSEREDPLLGRSRDSDGAGLVSPADHFAAEVIVQAGNLAQRNSLPSVAREDVEIVQIVESGYFVASQPRHHRNLLISFPQSGNCRPDDGG